MNTLIEEKAKTIMNNSSIDTLAIGILQSGEKRKLRLFKSAQGNYCYKAPRSKRYGYPLYNLELADLLSYNSTRRKSDAEVWRDSWIKVAKRLKKSKLYPDLLKDIETALAVGYDKLQEADKRYWEKHEGVSYEQSEELRAKRVKEIDDRLVKYTKEGKLCVNTSIVWYMDTKARIKKMRFKQYENEEALKRIAVALKKKVKHYENGRTSYDVSFKYNPEAQKAWYSEEFKNCGNGHYYLALDATHALFYEDD